MKTKKTSEKKQPKVNKPIEEDSDSSVYSDLEEEDESEEISGSEEDSCPELVLEEDESNLKDKGTKGKPGGTLKKSKDLKANASTKDNKFDKYAEDSSDEDSCPELVLEKDEDNLEKDGSTSEKNKDLKANAFSKDNEIDEYAEDSSDEEDIRNTVGNIPMEWYNEFLHIGYDVEGNKIMKPAEDDEIDDFLKKTDDPNYWRTVRNKMTNEKIVLTDEDIEIIKRIKNCNYPSASAEQYEPWEDFFTYEVMKHPINNQPPHKRSFVPSKIEKEKVARLVYAIKMGRIKPRAPKEKKHNFYMIWDNDDSIDKIVQKRSHDNIPAPKRKLPGHDESYNPPPEYLLTKEEEEAMQKQEPHERRLNFIPQKHECLRKVPGYSQFINEALDRCLDLYLCPRRRRMRIDIDPNDLIPKLPKPKDLKPFPTTQSIIYSGHEDMVRCITVEPQGQFLASGSDDGTVKVWEVLTGRCLRTVDVGGVVKGVAWCPSEALCLLIAVVNDKALLINPRVGDKIIISNTDALLQSLPLNQDNPVVQWSLPSDEQNASDIEKKIPIKEQSIYIKLVITHPESIKQVVWHAKGDYFATLVPKAKSKGILIHQLSQARSQVPFQRLKGIVQNILFHPLRPAFIIAKQRQIRIYNLLKQQRTQKLQSNSKWISCLAIHPHGDHVIAGTYDTHLSWFDLGLSNSAYKTMLHHKKAVRQVTFHKRYPLFASASDDGSIIVFHGMVYSDLMQNPLIVPVKVLRGHKIVNDLSVLDCCFHPTRPWLFSSGVDKTIILHT